MPLELRIPKNKAGRPLPEVRIKDGLRRLNPDIFFDVGSRLGMDHPYIEYRQGVYYDGFPPGHKHVCSMDRGHALDGLVLEVPVWSTIRDLVFVPWSEVNLYGEPILLPALHDPNLCQVSRVVRDEIILCGWRHTFDKLIAARIPGVTRSALEVEFGISLDCYVEAVDAPEEGAPAWENNSVDWDEPVSFEPKPTVVLAS